MPHDAYDIGDPETRPYRMPFFPRTDEGEHRLAFVGDDMAPRPGILNGRVYERVTPMPAGTRMHRRPYEYAREARVIELTIPDVPAIDPTTMTERTE